MTGMKDVILLCVVSVILIIVSAIDITKYIIPDWSVAILILLAVLRMYMGNMDIKDAVTGFCTGFFIFWLLRAITKSMGGGDVKLIGALGLVTGFRGILFIMFASIILCACTSVFLLVSGKKGMKDPVPFGPYISLAAILYIIWGNQLIGLYISFLTGGG